MLALLKDPNTLALIVGILGTILGWWLKHSSIKIPPNVLGVVEKIYAAYEEAQVHGTLSTATATGGASLPAVLAQRLASGLAVGAGVGNATVGDPLGKTLSNVAAEVKAAIHPTSLPASLAAEPAKP